MSTQDQPIQISPSLWPKGSEWRRWDPHVHTPESKLGAPFRSLTWDDYLDALEQAAKDSEISVIGVTDYMTIDGYERLLKEHRSNIRLETVDLLVPNIEFRIMPPTDDGKALNLHLLVDPKEPDHVERIKRALRNLKFEYGGETYGCCREELIEFGIAQDPSIKDDESAYKFGIAQFKPDRTVIQNWLDKAKWLKMNSLVGIANGKDGISGLPNDGFGAIRDEILTWCDFVFSGNPSDREHYLGKKGSTPKEKIIRQYGSLKPCIHGSDAHNVDALFKPDEDRFCWIKADPTFEGLKKTLIEPEDRVFIGECPEQLKMIDQRPTKFIKSVAVKKKSGSTLSEHWFDCDIPINPGLVAIIGNKGSGKSALGETIGLLGQTANAKAFSFLSPNRFRQPKNNKAAQFEGSLEWASGGQESVNLGRNPDPNTYELIKYIPQSYLETLCNELGAAQETGFDQELRSVIFSHVREEHRLGQTTLDGLIDYQTAQATAKIEILQKELKKITSKTVSLEARGSAEHRRKLEGALAAKQHELKGHEKNKPIEVPKPEASEKQKEKLENLSKQLTDKRAELSTAEEAITATRQQLSKVNLLLSAAQRILARIDNFERQAETFKTEVASDIEALSLKESEIITLKLSKEAVIKRRSTLLADQDKLERDLNSDEKESKVAIKEKVATELKQIQNQLDAPHKAYEAYLERIDTWKKTKKRIIGGKDWASSIEYYKEQLRKLNSLPGEIVAERKRAKEKTKEIFREKIALANAYRDLYAPVQAFIDSSSVAKDELQLRFDVQILDAGFSDAFFSFVSQGVRGTYCGTEEGRKRLKALLSDSDFSTEGGVATFVEKLVTSLLIDERDGETATVVSDLLKKGHTAQSLYDAIYGLDYLRPRYSLGMSGKALHELSPGERGALLLVFYLLVDQNEAPLIMDQPEENLDNQTVFKLLVPCIKEAKKRRQIAVITHNPNLAVVCDAEQIICCSINKQDGNRLTYQSGAIENPEINRAIVDILEGTRPAFDNRSSKYLE